MISKVMVKAIAALLQNTGRGKDTVEIIAYSLVVKFG